MAFAFRAKNLGPLREIDWKIPEGVSVVVGPNGVGKSTLLRLPEFARTALSDSLDAAVIRVFDGTAYLRHHGAGTNESLEFAAAFEDIEWRVVLGVGPGSLDQFATETISSPDAAGLRRTPLSTTVTIDGGDALPWDMQIIPRGIAERARGLISMQELTALPIESVVGSTVAKFLPSIPESARYVVGGALALCVQVTSNTLTYQTYRYASQHVAKYGSPQSPELKLQSTGENVFPLLRNWRDRSEYESRYEFVLSTLREIFPHLKKLDFEQAGQTVTVAVVDRRYPDKKTPISRESTGFLTALLHLCAIASCPQGGLVTLDELETSLHPRAIKVLIAAFRSWAREHNLSIVLATQSETVLDQFHDEPEKIFVMEPNMAPAPQPLTELHDRQWLSQFSLGDLFAHLEYGSGDAE